MLTVQINDPQTLEILGRYGIYVQDVDGVTGTLDQLAEGLILGMLDEHGRFRDWCRRQPTAATGGHRHANAA